MKVKTSGETFAQYSRAMFGGGTRTTTGTVEHDVAGDCLAPIPREIFGTQSKDLLKTLAGQYDHIPANTTIRHVRCRKCINCRRAHARHWAARCSQEISLSPRTWFCTLTMSVENHLLFEYSNRDKGKAVTDMFKRIRKGNKKAGLLPKKFRYCLVSEKHKSGFPHWHFFLHENQEGDFTSRLLSGNQKEGLRPAYWPYGFCHSRVVDPTLNSAWYVCKYITKDAQNRMRASQKYGKALDIARSA